MSTPEHDTIPKMLIARREGITNRLILSMYPERKTFTFRDVGATKVRELDSFITAPSLSFENKQNLESSQIEQDPWHPTYLFFFV